MLFSIASAPGNLFLTGEQAVVYGFPALLAAVQKRVYVKSSIIEEGVITVKSDTYANQVFQRKDVYQERPPASNSLYPIAKLAAIIADSEKKGIGISIEVSSEIPPEAGMSSSSATFAATAASVSHLLGVEVENLYDIIYPMQVWVHGGKASGSELSSSEYGGIHVFRKIEKANCVQPHIETVHSPCFSVVIGDTRVRAPTALPVGLHIPSLQRRKPSLVDQIFKKIGNLANEALKMITEKNIEGLGSILNENQKLLRELMVSHPKIDDAIQEALQAGALGAKLSGGGWGGVMFALVTPTNSDIIAKAIESTGCIVFQTQIGGPGIKIEEE